MSVRCSCALFAAACLLGLAAAPGAGQAGQMLYVSFDKPQAGEKDAEGRIYHIFSADSALGAAMSLSETRQGDARHRTVEAIQDGKFNGAASGSILFDAEGNVHLPQGTISLWFRPHGKGSRTLLTVCSLDEGYYLRAIWATVSGSGASVDFHDRDDSDSKRANDALAASGLSVEPMKWHHFVILWDETQGAKLFFDGKLAASNWGKVSWHAPAIPSAVGLGGGCADEFVYNSPVSGDALTDLDELRVFDRPLSDTEVRALFERNEPPTASAEAAWDEARAAHRRSEIGWSAERPLPECDVRGGTLLRPVPVSCRSAKKPRYAPFDGRRGDRRIGAWPFNYGTYPAQYTEGLTVEFPEAASANVVSVIGDFAGAFTCGSKADGAGKSFDFDGSKGEITTLALKEPVPLRQVHIMRSKGRVKDIGLYLWTPGAPKDQPARRAFLAPAEAAKAPVLLPTVFGPGDRAVLVTADAAPAAGALAAPPMRYVHLMTPPLKEAFALKAVRLDLTLAQAAPPGRLFVSLRDPFNPRGEKMYASFQFKGGSVLDLTLDVSGVMVPAGNQVWVTLLFEKGAQIALGGNRPSSLDLLTGDREQIVAAHVREQINTMVELFHRTSEARPFAYKYVAPAEQQRQFKRLQELCRVMQDLRTYAPDREELTSIQEWVYDRCWKDFPGMPFKFRAISLDDLAGPAGAARWAVLERELSALSRRWARWWVDERQDANGELEGGYNDDTDCVQGWANLVFISDEDGRLREGLRRLAEAGWKQSVMTNGLGAANKDILHTYEDGVNMEHLMADTEYGNPVWIERIMETCRNYDRLTAIGEDGKRHFLARRLSATTLTKGADSPQNAMMLQPALFLAWYNGNPRMIRLLSEWADSWITPAGKWTGNTNDVPSSFMLGVYELTGEERFLLPMRHKTSGMSTIGGQLDPDWLLQTPLRKEALNNPAFIKNMKEHWHNKMGVALDGTLFYGQAAPYITWFITRDKGLLEGKLAAGIEYMRRFFYALTAANQSVDRIPIPQMLLDRMMLGGLACDRMLVWHTHAVSWEGAGGDLAVFVTEHSRDGLNMLLYNFEDKDKDVAFRAWRLDHGQYEVAEGPDANGDDRMDAATRTRTMEIARYTRVPLRVPPRQLWAVRLKQAKRLDPILTRADLAVCVEDATFDPATGTLAVQVHNIGAAASGPFIVTLADAGGKTIETREIAHLDAPADLMPRAAALAFQGLDRNARVVVTLDLGDRIPEITKTNNTVTLPLAGLSAPAAAAGEGRKSPKP